MEYVIIPVIEGNKLSKETLDQLANCGWGYDVRPDGGFSYLVNSDVIMDYWGNLDEDEKTEDSIYLVKQVAENNIKNAKIFLVHFKGDKNFEFRK